MTTAKSNILYFDFHNFRLDLKNERLLIGGKPFGLTHKAFQMLEILVRNHGRVVEKDELFSKLWADSFVEETNLTQHIYILRKTLEQSSAGKQFIETIPKRGYRFNAEVKEVCETEISGDEPSFNEISTETRISSNLLNFVDKIVFENRLGNDGKQNFFPEIPAETESNKIKTGRRTVATNLSVLVNFLGSVYFLRFFGVVAAILIGAGLTGYFVYRSNPQPVAPTARSIAILPLKTIGKDSQNEKLGLGMSDAIIVRLSKLQQILVRPTSAVFRFTEQTDFNSSEVGRKLGVETVLEGTVQRDDERVRVSVQLIRVADGKPLWAENFDEKFTDIFALQDTISAKVARSLSLNLNQKDDQIYFAKETTNTEAYQAYLLGVYFWNTRTKDDLQKAVDHFKRAVELDPNYALAYAGLADSYNMQFFYGHAPREESFRKAKDAALKALELDETLAQAHIALSNIQIVSEKNYQSSLQSVERAVKFSPYNATARLRYAWALLRGRRLDEAVREMRLAQEYDPLSAVNNEALCAMLLFKRKFDEALNFCQRASEINPNTPTIPQSMANARFFKGERERAIAELESFINVNPQSYAELGTLGYFYAETGTIRKAEKIVETLRRAARDRPGFYNDLAVLSYALGRKTEAFGYLEKSMENGSLTNFALFDPTFDALRADPRYEELIKRKDYKDLPDKF